MRSSSNSTEVPLDSTKLWEPPPGGRLEGALADMEVRFQASHAPPRPRRDPHVCRITRQASGWRFNRKGAATSYILEKKAATDYPKPLPAISPEGVFLVGSLDRRSPGGFTTPDDRPVRFSVTPMDNAFALRNSVTGIRYPDSVLLSRGVGGGLG